MSHFTDEELLEIIETGESDIVEFKESLSGSAPESIRQAICAFANDLPDHRRPGACSYRCQRRYDPRNYIDYQRVVASIGGYEN